MSAADETKGEEPSLDELKVRFERQKTAYNSMQEDVARLVEASQKQQSLMNETTMCKEEVARLDESSTIYKLTGPILVKQDLESTRSNVEKRLEFITTQFKAVEDKLSAKHKEVEAARNDLYKLQATIQAREAAGASSSA